MNQSTYLWSESRDDWRRVGPVVPPDIDHLIVCRLPRPEMATYPATHDRELRGGPPPITVSSWQESTIAIAAHEAFHLWLHLHRAERLRAGRARQSEVEAEWCEYRLLQRWISEQ